MPEATFVPQTDLPVAGDTPDPVSDLEASLNDLTDSLDRLSAAAQVELAGATYVPPDDLMAGMAGDVVGSLMAKADAFQGALETLADDFRQEPKYFIPSSFGEQAGEEFDLLLDTYSTADGGATRLQVVLATDPFSEAAMDTAAEVRTVLKDAGIGTAYLSGSTATNLDMKDVMDQDFVRVVALVLGGIAIVLVLLLRSAIAPIYMLATILLSYGATVGIMRLVFEGIFGTNITWFVPFLIFVVLVALGMDYNIFLMGRVKEEVIVAGKDTHRGVERAVERTGGIITSAGIIMAGTFAAMMVSSLTGLVQIAFAVAVGVLLDTFIIRTTLMPAIATLLGKWNWWPGKLPED
jgi:RND superfamily putative drug exporter